MTHHRNVLRFFMRLQNMLKLYHWSTRSYHRHQASDMLINKLDPLIDRFVEIFLQNFGRPDMISFKGIALRVNKFDDATILDALEKVSQEISTGSIATIAESFPELCNIRDEMLSCIKQAHFLLTME